MSTSVPARTIDPNDPRLTEIPLRIPFIPPAPSTPYELRLVHHGLEKAAHRVSVNRVLRKWMNAAPDKFDLSDTWESPIFTTMLRSERYHASQLARKQSITYSIFKEFSRSQFMRIDVEYLSTSYGPDEIVCDRRDIRIIRGILDKYISAPKFSKIGTWQHRVMSKLLGIRLKMIVTTRVAEHIREEIEDALRELDCETYVSTWRVFDRENFPEELAAVLAPDLPTDGELCADFELLLQGMAQITYSGLSDEQAARFALSSKDSANHDAIPDAEEEILPGATADTEVPRGKIRMSNVPRSPKTGRPARFVSVTVDRETNPEDLDPTEWLEIIPPS